jgi:hypothetical protein
MTTLTCDFGGTRLKPGLVRDGKVVATGVFPAAVGRDTIHPTGASAERELATLNAFVRT